MLIGCLPFVDRLLVVCLSWVALRGGKRCARDLFKPALVEGEHVVLDPKRKYLERLFLLAVCWSWGGLGSFVGRLFVVCLSFVCGLLTFSWLLVCRLLIVCLLFVRLLVVILLCIDRLFAVSVSFVCRFFIVCLSFVCRLLIGCLPFVCRLLVV